MSLVFCTDYKLGYCNALIPEILLQTCLSPIHTAELNAIPQYKYILKFFYQADNKSLYLHRLKMCFAKFFVNHRATLIMFIIGWFCIFYSFFFHLSATYPLITQLWESKPPADSTLYHENEWGIEKGCSRSITVFYGCDLLHLLS